MGVYDRNKGRPGKPPNYWISFIGPDGRQYFEKAGPDRREAERLFRQRKREVADGTWAPPAQLAAATTTVADYAERWLKRRFEDGKRSAQDDKERLERHVLPRIGKRVVEELKPRDVRDLVLALVREKKLAPRTIRNVYGVFRTMMRDAVVDELIATNPCVLPAGTLPKKVDKNPTWRATALYTREEVVALITDQRIPEDRRIFYALEFLAGLRFGEAAGRRWRDWDASALPLGRLTVATQYDDQPLKTERPREVPVHPVLVLLLAHWKSFGFALYFGREPIADDLMVPSRLGRTRSHRHMHRMMHEDCDRLGLRPRRQHDARRTFITLCRTDGARKDVLEKVTHNAGGDIIDLYSSLPWPLLCEAVACLRIELPVPEPVISTPTLPEGVVGDAAEDFGEQVVEGEVVPEDVSWQGSDLREGAGPFYDAPYDASASTLAIPLETSSNFSGEGGIRTRGTL